MLYIPFDAAFIYYSNNVSLFYQNLQPTLPCTSESNVKYCSPLQWIQMQYTKWIVLYLHACISLETGGRSVQHCQPAVHCQAWLYHRVGHHHKPGWQLICVFHKHLRSVMYRNSGPEILIYRCINMFCAFLMCIQCGSNTQLLHVFQEDFILGYKPQKETEDFTPAFPSGEGIAPCQTSIVFKADCH